MNKQAFLQALERLTASLSDQERNRLLDYYGEMIDDRVEDGVSEEEAVAALGDPEAIAREFSPEARPVALAGAAEAVTALRRLRIQVVNADVDIVREPLPGGAAAQLRFSDPSRFEWRADGDTLEITEPDAAARLKHSFSFQGLRRLLTSDGLRVTVALSGGLPGDLDFTSVGGDLTITDVALGGAAWLQSVNGDFTLRQARFGEALEIATHNGDLKLNGVSATAVSVKSASGDIEASSMSVEGLARVETASGDVELRGARSGELNVTSASGDVEIDRGAAGDTAVRTASGDVRLDELESDPCLAIHTVSGDIDLTRCIAREARLETVSGDVTLRLAELPCGYDIAANTRSGDIRLPSDNPAGEGQPRIAVNTTSGDIDARIV